MNRQQPTNRDKGRAPISYAQAAQGERQTATSKYNKNVALNQAKKGREPKLVQASYPRTERETIIQFNDPPESESTMKTARRHFA
jgi:hypothetical protein